MSHMNGIKRSSHDADSSLHVISPHKVENRKYEGDDEKKHATRQQVIENIVPTF